MNILVEHPPAPTEFPAARFRAWVNRLFLLGVLLRAVACFTSIPFVHPDEHQQYLEQSFRYLHGFGMTYWEQDEGIRHPFYSGLLAGLLWCVERAGVADPVTQNALLHLFVAVLSLLASRAVAVAIYRRGDPAAALLFMFGSSVFPEVIFVQCRVLTENAMMIPILLAISMIRERPLLAGVLLGLAFGIRFHAGFLILGIVIQAWISNVGGGFLRLEGDFSRFALGLAASLLCMGGIDWVVYGQPFFSPVQYFVLNILEGRANEFGVDPWYRYFEWAALWGWGFLAVAFAVMCVGAWREWRIFMLLSFFLLIHCLVSHKEGRFLFPLIPFSMILVAAAFGQVDAWLPERWRSVWRAAAVLAILVGAAVRVTQVPWSDPRAEPVSRLLAEARKCEDLHGVGVFQCDQVASGNYFFLQRDVPLRYATVYLEEGEALSREMTQEAADTLVERDHWGEGRINYLICRADEVAYFDAQVPVLVKGWGEWGLYRLQVLPKK